MPNEAHDWLNQRDGIFETFIPISDHKKYDISAKSVFVVDSNGIQTNRDAWVYNYSLPALQNNIDRAISFYNAQLEIFNAQQHDNRVEDVNICLDTNPLKFSWTRSAKNNIARNVKYNFDSSHIRIALYRPFCKQNLYFSKRCNEYVNQWPRIFPTPQTKNLVICVSGVGGKSFSTLMTEVIPDLHILESGTQCFPLYYYEKIEREQLGLFDKPEGDYVRHDGITDFILQRAREQYGPKCTKTDVFYYIYGLLHSPDYRTRFEADLTKMLPRIPLLEDVKTFRVFSTAGRELAEIHINYETAEPWGEVLITGADSESRIEKMRFAKTNGEDDKRTIILNAQTKVENIPLLAYDYLVNGKSALEWLMERYSYSVHPESHIANDPNAWGQEHAQPHYVLNLLLRIITVSMKTLQIVSKLPRITFPTN